MASTRPLVTLRNTHGPIQLGKLGCIPKGLVSMPATLWTQLATHKKIVPHVKDGKIAVLKTSEKPALAAHLKKDEGKPKDKE